MLGIAPDSPASGARCVSPRVIEIYLDLSKSKIISSSVYRCVTIGRQIHNQIVKNFFDIDFAKNLKR
jgi:hypothetical protein